MDIGWGYVNTQTQTYAQIHTHAQIPAYVQFFVVIYVVFYLICKILNTAPYVLRRGMYACVHRWVVYVRPRGV